MVAGLVEANGYQLVPSSHHRRTLAGTTQTMWLCIAVLEAAAIRKGIVDAPRRPHDRASGRSSVEEAVFGYSCWECFSGVEVAR